MQGNFGGKKPHSNRASGELWATLHPSGKCSQERQVHLCWLNGQLPWPNCCSQNQSLTPIPKQSYRPGTWLQLAHKNGKMCYLFIPEVIKATFSKTSTFPLPPPQHFTVYLLWMLGYSHIISARAFKEPRARKKISMEQQHLVRTKTHVTQITCTLQHSKNTALLFCLLKQFYHLCFNLMLRIDCEEFHTFQRLNLVFSIWCRWEISTKEKAGWRSRGITWKNKAHVSVTSTHLEIFHHSASSPFHERQKPKQHFKLCFY